MLIDDGIIEIDTGDDTDGPIDLLNEVVQKVKTDFECVLEDPNKKNIFMVLIEIIARLLSANIKNFNQITNIIRISLSKIVKLWSEEK